MCDCVFFFSFRVFQKEKMFKKENRVMWGGVKEHRVFRINIYIMGQGRRGVGEPFGFDLDRWIM